MTPEQLADAMHQEVVHGCWADVMLLDATGAYGKRPINELERAWIDCGIEVGYKNTLEMLIRRGLLPSGESS